METEKRKNQKIANLFRLKINNREAENREVISRDEKEKIKAEKFIREGLSDVDYSLLKIFTIIIITTASAFLFSYALVFWSLIHAVVIGLFSVSLIVFIPLFLKSWSLHLASAFIISIAFILPLSLFKDIPATPMGVVVVVSIIMLIGGFVSAKRELNNSLRISFTKFSGKIITRALTVIALVLAIAYGWNFQARTLFSDQFISTAITFSSPLIKQYVSGFTPDMKLSDFFNVFAKQSFIQHDSANFALLPIDLQQQLISQSTTSLYDTIESSLGTDMNLESSFQENLKIIILDKVVTPIEKIPAERLSLIATIIIFIAVRGPLWFLGWLIIAVSFILFQLLLAIKFAETYLELRSKEIVLIK